MCNGIRAIERALGSFDKRVTNSERKNKLVARKSIVAKRDIKKGKFLLPITLLQNDPEMELVLCIGMRF